MAHSFVEATEDFYEWKIDVDSKIEKLEEKIDKLEKIIMKGGKRDERKESRR